MTQAILCLDRSKRPFDKPYPPYLHREQEFGLLFADPASVPMKAEVETFSDRIPHSVTIWVSEK
jgi:hypothetical protein